jgi:hypothetical protein
MTPQSHSCRSALIGSTGIAELPPRGQGGFFPGHPLRHESVREQLQVFLDFVIETIITWLFAQKPAHPRRERPQPRLSTCPHTYPSSCSSRSTRPITVEMRSQFSVSTSNCFRPRLLME